MGNGEHALGACKAQSGLWVSGSTPAQAFTFLLGGYETTASALSFTIYLLSANPDKATRLAQACPT